MLSAPMELARKDADERLFMGVRLNQHAVGGDSGLYLSGNWNTGFGKRFVG
jgi:hypothetical protein